jgi:hypothetical protein
MVHVNSFTEMLNAITFAQFTWDYVSIPDKVELEASDMFDCKHIDSRSFNIYL